MAAPVVVLLKTPPAITSPNEVNAMLEAESAPVPPRLTAQMGENAVAAAGSSLAAKASRPPALDKVVPPKGSAMEKLPATATLPLESTAMPTGEALPVVLPKLACAIKAPAAPLNLATQMKVRLALPGPTS